VPKGPITRTQPISFSKVLLFVQINDEMINVHHGLMQCFNINVCSGAIDDIETKQMIKGFRRELCKNDAGSVAITGMAITNPNVINFMNYTLKVFGI